MIVQNTLTQPELDMVLQFCTSYSEQIREGKKLFHAINILKPALAEEIKDTELNPFYKDVVPAEIYAAICPDPPRMPEGFECPYCGRLLDDCDLQEQWDEDDINTANEIDAEHYLKDNNAYND